MIKHIPNILSFSRIIAASFLFTFNDFYNPVFLCIYVFCAATDFFDGKIARKYKCESKLGAALDRYEGCDLAVAGGVAANSHIRAALERLAKKKGARLHIPKPSLCGDNAAMIAAQGYYEYMGGLRHGSSLNASAEDSIKD